MFRGVSMQESISLFGDPVSPSACSSSHLPRHVVDQGAPVDLRGVLKHAFVEALLDDLPDGRLRESAGVDLLHLGLNSWTPLNECRLQSNLDEAVV